jgi:hypothetical protein
LDKLLSIDPTVLKRLKNLPKDEKVECLLALSELSEVFGKPHLHTGLSIRKLGPNLFECRGTKSLRFLFQNRASDLYIAFLGNHDEIKRLLQSGRG